jgi:hypothetical protein
MRRLRIVGFTLPSEQEGFKNPARPQTPQQRDGRLRQVPFDRTVWSEPCQSFGSEHVEFLRILAGYQD